MWPENNDHAPAMPVILGIKSMNPYDIDCRGLDCPAPVLKTKEAIDADPGLTRIRTAVDNDAAVENVSRFLTHNGFEVAVDARPDLIIVEGAREASDQAPRPLETPEISCPIPGDRQKIMVMVTSRAMGQGDDILGVKLMESFLKTLKEMGDDLWRLVFVNGGVELTIRDSRIVEDLKALEDEGIRIMVCGTCLTHFDLLKEKAVGETTNMLDIVTAMQLAHKVITL